MTTDTTTAVADRAAIEALARELTDRQWSVVFTVAPDPTGMWGSVRIADLLAYLDEVWAGLSNVQRNACEVLMDAGASRKAVVAAGSLLPSTLVVWDERGLPARTPLDRAVLRRAKEQGHAGA